VFWLVLLLVMMAVVGDERGFVYSCPVTRMAGTLALRSPFFAACKRDRFPILEARFPILLVGLHADIVKQKWHTRETCSFVNHTSMRLKIIALASHQNLFAIL
jgi:hypothetical protein